MDSISIQKISSDDLEMVLPLIKQMIDFHSSIDDSYFKLSDAMGEENIKEHILALLEDKSIQILLVKNDSVAIGYIMGQIDTGSPDQKIDKIGKIIDLFVLPEWRGKGVGTQLQDQLFDWFKDQGIKRVELNVYSRNTEAISVWEKLGFQEFRKVMFKEI